MEGAHFCSVYGLWGEHSRADDDSVSLVGVLHLQDSKVAALAEGSKANPFSKAFNINAKQALKKGECRKGPLRYDPFTHFRSCDS
jgi:hypothetical protein